MAAPPLGVSAEPTRLARGTPGEYLLRFVYGGLVTAGAGLVAAIWGPVVGGLFLAFPSILPASLTLVAKHAHTNRAAGADALGAACGSLGMVAFAVVCWQVAPTLSGWLMLGLAAVAWAVVSLVVWACIVRGPRKR